ncbi:DUF4238 domain-containing protein [Priestia megaterium]|uniref:DUF4238 domain-containing protein n=1 Tax=Priestia megaterium TaxID=1404 RepID=UPI00300A37EA
MKNNPAKQHTVPKTYLKHFSHNSKNIFVYDKNKNIVEERNIKSVSIIKDFYTFVDEETGEKHYDLENLLGESIEPNYNSAIDSILKNGTLENSAKVELAKFMAAQLLRSPKTKKVILDEVKEVYLSGESKRFTDPQHLETLKQSFEMDGTPISKEEFEREMKKENVRVIVDVEDPCYLQQMGNKLVQLIKEMLNKEWTLLLTPAKRSLITSDNPIFNTEDYPNILFGRLKGEIFVLTKQLGVMVSEKREIYNYNYIDLDVKEVRTINRAIQLNSDRWIFSHSRELLCKNIKHVNTKVTV